MIMSCMRKVPYCRAVIVGGKRKNSDDSKSNWTFDNKKEIFDLLLDGCVFEEDVTFNEKDGSIHWFSHVPPSACIQGSDSAYIGDVIVWDENIGFCVFPSMESFRAKYNLIQ